MTDVDESELSEVPSIKERVLVARSKKTHICQFCQKVFHKAAKLTVHLRIHTGERPFSCEVCGKSYSRNAHLIRHTLTQHTPLESRKIIACEICHAVFSSQDHLRNHRSSPSRCLRHQCPLCGLVASSLWHLTKHHETKHSPSPADLETKKSKNSTSLLVCYEGCDMIFQSKSERKAHITQCHGYCCRICGVQCDSARQRRDHILSHHSLRHPCGEPGCEASFTTVYNLHQHIQSVHRKRKLVCITCGANFNTKSSLRRHVRTKHEELNATVKEDGNDNFSSESDQSLRSPPAKRKPYAAAAINRLVGISSEIRCAELERIIEPRMYHLVDDVPVSERFEVNRIIAETTSPNARP